jgi:hypothetical protein
VGGFVFLIVGRKGRRRATDAGEFSDGCYNLEQSIVFFCCPMTRLLMNRGLCNG